MSYNLFPYNIRSLSFIPISCSILGVGRFHAWLLLVLAWVHCADALGYTSMSYVMPPASCELDATDLDLSLITTMGLVGKWNSV